VKNPKTFGQTVLVLSLFLISTLSIGLWTTSIRPVYATPGPATLTEWPIPTANSGPVSIILDPSGNCCWFAESATNNIAQFDPTTNTFKEWAIPTANSNPQGLASTTISSMPAIFGTEFGANKVFVFFPTTGVIKEYALPTANSGPEYISVEPSGAQARAWFTEATRNAWGELVYDPLTPAANTYEDVFPAAVGGIANGVYAGSGTIWFAGAKAIVRYDRSTVQYSMWTLPSHGSANGAFLALDTLGQVWYTQGVANNAADPNNYVGVLRGDNTFKDWQVPSAGADMRGISVNPLTQQPWAAEFAYAGPGAAKITVVDPSTGGTITPSFPSTQAYAGGVTAITPAVLGPIGPATNSVAPTSSSNTGVTSGAFTEWALSPKSGPHDLVVDSSGAVWMVESQNNKIAKLTLSQPDFSLSANPGTLSVAQGSSGTVTVTGSSILTYTGGVTLSITGSVPSGVTFSSFNPNPVNIPSGSSATSSFTVNVGPSATLGPAVITVSGTQGSLTHTTSFTLTVTSSSDFSLGLSAPSVSVAAGGSVTDTATITSLGSFNSAVVLSTTGSMPGGLHVSFSSTSVTPSSGGSVTSIVTISVDTGTTPQVVALNIAGTSGSLVHSAPLSITITGPPTPTPDFSLSTNPTSLSIGQGLSGTSTITVSSSNGFNSAVVLDYSWAGTAPSGVSVSIPSPVTPPAGSTATSTLTVTTTSSATLGTFTLQVSGSSGALSHGTNIALTVAPAAKCLIATATYGSEVAPEVQLLRNFRDNSLMKTKSGSSFMLAFNAWYYSFSPGAAAYLNTHWVEQAVMKGVLYPLVGILYLTSNLFSAASSFPEFAALISGLLASSLIGAFYLGVPLGMLRARFRRLRNWKDQGMLERVLAAMLLGGLVTLLFGELFSSQPALIISTATIVLSTLSMSSAIVSKKICNRF
jgi:streptogramin lyase